MSFPDIPTLFSPLFSFSLYCTFLPPSLSPAGVLFIFLLFTVTPGYVLISEDVELRAWRERDGGKGEEHEIFVIAQLSEIISSFINLPAEFMTFFLLALGSIISLNKWPIM